MNAYDTDYDVVLDTLENKIQRLQKMLKDNMQHNMMSIMDEIRLQQIYELELAQQLWKQQNERL